MEQLIQRAAMGLGVGLSEAEVCETLMANKGHGAEETFLAIKAAKILNKDREDKEGKNNENNNLGSTASPRDSKDS